jgi:hypothetical protein
VKTGLAARLVAAIGAVLTIVGIFLDAIPGISYWDSDGTLAWTGLILAAAALLLIAAGHLRSALDGWVFAIGAVLAGYWSWFPAVTAFDDWDQTRAGMWLCLGGALLIAVGSAVTLLAAGRATTTPGGQSPALVAGLGIVLVFPGIFLDADGCPLAHRDRPELLGLWAARALARDPDADPRGAERSRGARPSSAPRRWSSTPRTRSSCSAWSPSCRPPRPSTASGICRPAPGSRSPAGSSPRAARGQPEGEAPQPAAAGAP